MIKKSASHSTISRHTTCLYNSLSQLTPILPRTRSFSLPRLSDQMSLEIPLTDEILESIKHINPEDISGDDIDFEKLGINMTALSDQLAQALHREFAENMKQTTETLDSLDWPFFAVFYGIILILSYFVFRAKSNIPSIFTFFSCIVFIGLSELINLYLHDLNRQLFEVKTSENIFDLAGFFMNFEIIPPVLFLACVCIVRWVWNVIEAKLCTKRRKPAAAVVNNNTTTTGIQQPHPFHVNVSSTKSKKD